MASKEVAVKKYVVRLSEEERARLEEFVRKGKRAAHVLTKARNGVPHGLDVAHQRSCELLHRGKARSSSVMKETLKFAWVAALQKTSELHRQPPHRDKARRGFLQSADLRSLRGVSVGVGFMQRDAATIGEICQPVLGSMARVSLSVSTFAGGGDGV